MSLTSYHKERYGQWAGNEKGNRAEPGLCAKEVQMRDTPRFKQCSRHRGYGPEGAFCKQHAKEYAEEP